MSQDLVCVRQAAARKAGRASSQGILEMKNRRIPASVTNAALQTPDSGGNRYADPPCRC